MYPFHPTGVYGLYPPQAHGLSEGSCHAPYPEAACCAFVAAAGCAALGAPPPPAAAPAPPPPGGNPPPPFGGNPPPPPAGGSPPPPPDGGTAPPPGAGIGLAGPGCCCCCPADGSAPGGPPPRLAPFPAIQGGPHFPPCHTGRVHTGAVPGSSATTPSRCPFPASPASPSRLATSSLTCLSISAACAASANIRLLAEAAGAV